MKRSTGTLACVLVLCVLSGAAAAMATVPYPGALAPEPNRLTTKPGSRDGADNPYVLQGAPFLGLTPYAAPARPPRRQPRGPGFLNADPFDPNSVVNSFDRNTYANPYPYDPYYNPYGQAPSNYAPRGGGSVPMGNGIPYGR